jgi:hypothetical protein
LGSAPPAPELLLAVFPPPLVEEELPEVEALAEVAVAAPPLPPEPEVASWLEEHAKSSVALSPTTVLQATSKVELGARIARLISNGRSSHS